LFIAREHIEARSDSYLSSLFLRRTQQIQRLTTITRPTTFVLCFASPFRPHCGTILSYSQRLRCVRPYCAELRQDRKLSKCQMHRTRACVASLLHHLIQSKCSLEVTRITPGTSNSVLSSFLSGFARVLTGAQVCQSTYHCAAGKTGGLLSEPWD
jgi:hypothetical protein